MDWNISWSEWWLWLWPIHTNEPLFERFLGVQLQCEWMAGRRNGGSPNPSRPYCSGVGSRYHWANITGSSSGAINFNGAPIGTATLSSTLSSVSTARARVGYALENWLFFATGGLAVTNEKSNLTGPVGFVCGTGAFNSPPCSSIAELHLGLSAGAGVEYGITQNLSAKGEWIWVGAGAGNTLKENMLRLGLDWRLGSSNVPNTRISLPISSHSHCHNRNSCTAANSGRLCGAFNSHVDFAAEHPEVDWFGQQRLGAVLQSLAFGLRVAIGGDHDDRDVGS